MIIGIVKEIKDMENRVGLTPKGAKELVKSGSKILVEKNAGLNSGFNDEEYMEAGAEIADAEKAWNAELIIKVKEPLESEYKFLKGQILFTFLHLANEKNLTEALLKSKTTSIAYETVEDENGKLPLLAPMSAVAGNMSVTMGSYYLAKFNGGNGMQLGSVLGKKYGKVVVLGDGIVGKHAAKNAYGLGSNVYMFTRHEDRFEKLKKEIGSELNCVLSTKENIAEHVKAADLVVGAVLKHGSKAPWIVTEEMVKTMKKGSVIVDVSVDQGGCIETSKPTSHSNPIFVKHGVIHYCVTNMPGAYPRTSTIALTEATLHYILRLAKKGLDAVKADEGFAKGVNTHKGHITYKPIADALKMDFKELNELI